MIVLISVWPGLQILAGQRRPRFRGQFDQRRNVGGQVGRRVRIRNAFPDRRVGVDHARGNRGVVRLEPSNAAMSACAGASVAKISVLPHQTMTRRSRLLSALNLRMSAMTCSARSFLFLPFLTFGPVEPLDVALIEHRRPRPDLLELGPDLVEQRRLEHAGGVRRRVAVVLEDVPAAEHEIVERGQRHDLADLRRPVSRCACPDGSCPSASASRSASRDLCGWRARRRWSSC